MDATIFLGILIPLDVAFACYWVPYLIAKGWYDGSRKSYSPRP